MIALGFHPRRFFASSILIRKMLATSDPRLDDNAAPEQGVSKKGSFRAKPQKTLETPSHRVQLNWFVQRRSFEVREMTFVGRLK